MAAILLGAVVVTGALAFGRDDGDDDQNQPVQVHLTGALQAIETGGVSLLYLNDASRRAMLVLADGREVYSLLWLGAVASMLGLASLVDRGRVGRGKPSWRASVRAGRLEAQLGRIEAELSTLRRREESTVD